jgi:DNA-binding GntR family transcriptional regulator
MADTRQRTEDTVERRCLNARGCRQLGGRPRTVLEQVTPLIRRVERVRFSSLTGRGSVAMHDKIISLCAAGDADQAGLAARVNWQTLTLLLDSDPNPTSTKD